MALIIAEIGHNHNGDMSIARELIHSAKECGADIVKFQIYDTAKIVKPDHKWYWDLERGQLTREQWFRIVNECNKAGIEFLASVFDTERVGWCEEVGMLRYKIASRSIYENGLINKVTLTGKEIIVSLGMVDERGVPSWVMLPQVHSLYCVSKYPTMPTDIDFPDFDKYAGFSDHTIGIEAAVVAMARGARIIEKHFTLDKTMHGADHTGSMEPSELKQLVQFSKNIEALLCSEKYENKIWDTLDN